MPRSDGALYPWEERALKTAHRRVPMPTVPLGGVCRWCERTIVGKRGKYLGRPALNRSWCREEGEGRDCWHEFALHSRAETQSYFLIGRDGERCAQCGDNGSRWIVVFEASDRTYIHRNVELEVDHIIPLWKVALMVGLTLTGRRAYFGPRNLQLLCGKCHKAKCAAEAAERAALKRGQAPSSPPDP